MHQARFVRIWHRPEIGDYLVMVIGQDGGLLEWRPYPYHGDAMSRAIAEIDAREDAASMGVAYHCDVKEIGG